MRSLLCALLLVACRGDAPKATGAGSGSPVASRPPPAPRRRPAATPPSFAGVWRIGDYDVTVPPLAGAYFDSFDASFGLKVGIGKPSSIGWSDSTLELAVTCDGVCDPATYETVVSGKYPARLHDNMQHAHPDAQVDWVQRPEKLGDNQWWWQLRARNSREVVAEQAVVVMWSPTSRNGFLQCAVDTVKDAVPRTPELVEACKQLAWTPADPARPFVLPFGDVYVGRDAFELATPPGFSLRSYKTSWLDVRLRGPDIFDELTLREDCNGPCDEPGLAAAIAKAFADEAIETRPDQPPVEVVKPVREVTPQRWVQRTRHAPWQGFPEDVVVTVRALRPRTDRYMTCQAKLTGDLVRRADEMEKICLAAFEGW